MLGFMLVWWISSYMLPLIPCCMPGCVYDCFAGCLTVCLEVQLYPCSCVSLCLYGCLAGRLNGCLAGNLPFCLYDYLFGRVLLRGSNTLQQKSVLLHGLLYNLHVFIYNAAKQTFLYIKFYYSLRYSLRSFCL